ncbi:MAG: DUF4136 domain-containing protein [Bacteroidota bacterium]
MKVAGYFLLVFLFISCQAIRVDYDYDEKTNFSDYTTFNYYPDMDTGLSELDTRRLLGVLDIALKAKGLVYSEEPDFLINISSDTYQSQQNSAVGVGVGGTGRNLGGGVNIGVPIGGRSLERQIQFDFVDTRKDMLFWQAISESAFREKASPEEREQNLREIVEKVFSKYPPGPKK